MATNTAIAYYLDHNPVPADRECVASGSEILQLVKDFGFVAGLASTVGGSGVIPLTNNQIAGLTTRVGELETDVSALQDNSKERRVAARSVGPISGDSRIPLTWAPPLSSTDYEVRVTLEGLSDFATARYGWRVVSGTKTTSSVQIVIENAPPSTYYSVVVETL